MGAEREGHYERWLQATPQQRLQVKAAALAKSFETGKYCMVEQRASLEGGAGGLPNRPHCNEDAIIFAILCRWQPGGKLERAQVLDVLVHPEAAGSVEDTVEGISAAELGAVLPDSSLLLKGLDTLTLGEHPVVAFPVAAYRNETGVDFPPF